MAHGFDRKSLVALAVALGFFLALYAFGEYAGRQHREDMAHAEVTQRVQVALATVDASLLAMETAQQGFLLTQEPGYLEPYPKAAAQLAAAMAALAAHADESRPALVALSREVGARRADLELTVELARQRGTEAARAHVRSGAGKAQLESVRSLLASMGTAEALGLTAQQAAAAASLRRNEAIAWVLRALLVLLLAAVFVLMRRELHARRRAEQAEHVAVVGLEARVAQRTRELEQASLALQISEARLRAIFDAAGEAILTVDAMQTIVMANPAAATIFGWPLTELTGVPLERLIPPRHRAQHPADMVAFADADAGVRAMGRGHGATGLRRDGSEFPLEAAISYLHLDGQRLFTIVLRDITELRRAQRELAASHADLQRLVHAQSEVQEHERKRIARELHDDLQQTLAAIQMDLMTATGRIASAPAQVAPLLAAARELADTAIDSTRRIINDLRPQILDDLGLVPALRSLAAQFTQRTGIECELSTHGIDDENGDFPAPTATALFRVAQEALNNVAKHSGAAQVQIQLTGAPGLVTLRVKDDGRGMAEADRRKPGSFGLMGIGERARALGGSFNVRQRRGGGTRVEISLPQG